MTAKSDDNGSITTRDASDVGVPCSICSSIDFLPFRCTLCDRSFCKEHSSAAQPAAHDCPAYTSTLIDESERGRDGTDTFKSLLPDRNAKPEVKPLTSEEIEKQRKKDAALALLHKNFPKTASATSKATSSTTPGSKSQNRTIMIMKLKQNAQGVDPSKGEKAVPMKERRFFFARYGKEGENKPYWLPATCSCGRALDLLATALKVPNKNNLPTTPAQERLVLVGGSDTSAPLQTGKSIGESIPDGDEILLLKMSELS